MLKNNIMKHPSSSLFLQKKEVERQSFSDQDGYDAGLLRTGPLDTKDGGGPTECWHISHESSRNATTPKYCTDAVLTALRSKGSCPCTAMSAGGFKLKDTDTWRKDS